MDGGSGIFIDESKFLRDALGSVDESDSFENVQNAFETAKEYWEYSKPDTDSWIDFIKNFFYIFQFSVEESISSLFNLYSQSSRENKKAILGIIDSTSSILHKSKEYLLISINIKGNADLHGVKWGIAINGNEIKILDCSKRTYENNFVWANLDEILRHNHIDSFYKLFKVLRMIERSGNNIKNPNELGKLTKEQKEFSPKQTNYWIFIVKDHFSKDEFISAKEVMNIRMEDRFWGLGERTANRLKLRKGDHAIIYRGSPEKIFAGEFILSSSSFRLTPNQHQKYSRGNELLDAAHGVLLEDIDIWNESKPVGRLIPQLNFIRNKSNWGAFFQGGVKAISFNDYQTIVDGK